MTNLWDGRSEVRIPVGARDLSPKPSDYLWCPSSLLFNVFVGPFPGVKQLWHEVKHSRPPSVELGISGAVPLLPLCAFIACTGTSLSFTLCYATLNV